MKPLISREYAGTQCLLNPARPYVKADKTNIRETFDKVAPGWNKSAALRSITHRG